MKIAISRAARDDLATIWIYGAERWSVDQAERYTTRMMPGISGLAENPHMAPLVIELASNMRLMVIGAHVVFYRAGDEVVEVVRVPHQRMDAADRLEGA